jgi:ribonuclease T1
MNPKFFTRWLIIMVSLLFSLGIAARQMEALSVVAMSDLPPEAQKTLMLIKQGGPFPYVKDGIAFGNYEGVLPKQKRGYYHEFTVKTPRARNRGARRIITGGEPATSGEYYYTDDHYATFRRIKE